MKVTRDSQEWYVARDARRLYQLKDMARACGVSPAAMSNWSRRRTGPKLPMAPYRTVDGAPLWTGDQIQAVIAARIAAIETYAAQVGGPE